MILSLSYYVLDQQEMPIATAQINKHVKTDQSLTLFLNSVEAPNSKRNFTTSLWPCCAAKNRAVAPDCRNKRGNISINIPFFSQIK